MSYEPTNWKSGDVVTSAKLNKLEQGVAGGGVFVATYTGVHDEQTDEITYICDKTFAEIYSAIQSGMHVVAREDRGFGEYTYCQLNKLYDTTIYFLQFEIDMGNPNLNLAWTNIMHGAEDGEEYISVDSNSAIIAVV